MFVPCFLLLSPDGIHKENMTFEGNFAALEKRMRSQCFQQGFFDVFQRENYHIL